MCVGEKERIVLCRLGKKVKCWTFLETRFDSECCRDVGILAVRSWKVSRKRKAMESLPDFTALNLTVNGLVR